MIIEKDLKCTPEEFYTYMIDSVIEQIENSFGKRLQPEDIKSGYSHKTQFTNKKTGARRTTKYTIKKAVPNEEFETVYTSADYRSKVGYKISPAPKGMHIIYEQDTEFFNKSEQPKGSGGALDQWFLKQKLSRSISKVEREIIKRRKNGGFETDEEEEGVEA